MLLTLLGVFILAEKKEFKEIENALITKQQEGDKRGDSFGEFYKTINKI